MIDPLEGLKECGICEMIVETPRSNGWNHATGTAILQTANPPGTASLAGEAMELLLLCHLGTEDAQERKTVRKG